MTGAHVAFLSNHGDLGGGEVMMLRMAEAARDLGLDVEVVAPAASEVLDLAASTRLACRGVPGRDRRRYLLGLAHWAPGSAPGLLWCNGLVPGLATAGRRGRVLHLHQLPSLAQRPAVGLARARVERLLVPSAYVAERMRGAEVLANWTDETPFRPRAEPHDPVVLGFLGRHSAEKGLHVLAAAIAELERLRPGGFRLALGGEPRFTSARDARLLRGALAAVEPLTTAYGWVDRDAFLAQVDVACFPSVGTESFGLVAAEAMALGVPYVVSAAGALPEVAGPDHPWVVPAGDPVALAHAVLDVADDADARGDAVRRGRERWERLYSPEAGVARLARVLAGLGLPVAVPGARA